MRKRLAILTLIIGCGAIIIALTSDLWIPGERTGFGKKQLLLLFSGIVLLAGSLFLISPLGERLLKRIRSSAEKDQQPLPVPIVAVWFGAITGLGEAIFLGYRKYIAAEQIYRSQYFHWMVIVGDILLFSAVGILITLLLSWWLKKSVVLRIAVLTFAFLGFTSWLFLFPRISMLASLILALGLSYQASRMIMQHTDRFYWLIRFSIPALLIFLVFLIVGSLAWQRYLEFYRISQLPPLSSLLEFPLFVMKG